MEGKGFFTNTEIRDLHRPRKCQASKDDVEIDDQPSMFVCPEEGCNCTFDSFSELELHTDVGIHDTRKSGSLYDKLQKNRAEKFSSIENRTLTSNKSSTGLTVNRTNSRLSIGWALTKGRTGGVRFSENVRRYLTTRFEMEEGTGKKANPEEIERQMRNARNARNERLFQREEWLTETQISRLASRQRTRVQDAISQEQTFDITADENDDIDALIGDSDRNNLLDDIQSRIGL